MNAHGKTVLPWVALGFLTVRETEPIVDRGGRPRFLYSLTAHGRFVVDGVPDAT